MKPLRKVSTPSRQLFLTFDDGPCPDSTGRVLEILKDCQAQATFFVIGERALAHPQLVERILQEGHQLGDHSFDHTYHHFFKKKEHLKDWILDSHEKIESRFGVRPVGFRSPAGVVTPPLAQALSELNIPWIHWNHRFFDTNIPIRWLEFFHSYEPGDIILLHDRQKKNLQQSFYGDLRELLNRLRNKGFDFSALKKEQFPHGVS